MSEKELFLQDEQDLRFSKLVKKLNEKFQLNIKRNTDDISSFKWIMEDLFINEINLLNLIIFNHKTLIPIKMKFIKEALKQNKKMIFIFYDEMDNRAYRWNYNAKDLLMNYNSLSDFETVSIFDSSCEVLRLDD
jgi:hypothetical protein